MSKKELPVEGRHRRLYEESLVRNIMLAVAYCVKDLLEDNPDLDDEDVYEFVEENYQGIIQDTLEEFQKDKEDDTAADPEEDRSDNEEVA